MVPPRASSVFTTLRLTKGANPKVRFSSGSAIEKIKWKYVHRIC